MGKAQILVVEDDNIVVMELEDSLQSLGYAVSAVASYGEEAIEKAAETRPNLVLMDIRLKGDVNGIRAAQEIRERCGVLHLGHRRQLRVATDAHVQDKLGARISL